MPGLQMSGGQQTASTPQSTAGTPLQYGPSDAEKAKLAAEAAYIKDHPGIDMSTGVTPIYAANFGGYAQGANDASNMYNANADAWANRSAPQLDMTNANAARGYGADALARLQATANGAPTAADAQLAQNVQASRAAQAAGAASARGGASNIAAAQRGAVMQQANITGQGAQDASILRAQQMAQARQQLGQQAVAQQGADVQGQLDMAGVQQTQQQIDQAGQLGFSKLSNDVQAGQLAAQTSEMGALYGYQGTIDQINDANSAAYTSATASGTSGLLYGLSQSGGSQDQNQQNGGA